MQRPNFNIDLILLVATTLILNVIFNVNYTAKGSSDKISSKKCKCPEDKKWNGKKCVKKTRLVLFNYTESKWSFTTNLSNELFGHYPEKMIIISRRKSEEVKCSLRGKNVRSILEKALVGVEGRGGGHPDACGAVIKEKDWDLFLTHFNEALDDL